MPQGTSREHKVVATGARRLVPSEDVTASRPLSEGRRGGPAAWLLLGRTEVHDRPANPPGATFPISFFEAIMEPCDAIIGKTLKGIVTRWIHALDELGQPGSAL